MIRVSRLLSAGSLVVASVVVLTPSASAAVDASCDYAAGKKLVTLRLPADDFDEGPFVIGRVPGSKRIGYDTDETDWKRCSSATVTNTKKVKVVGSQHSEHVVLSLEGGSLAPGAANERKGVSEIEIVGDLGDGTDTLTVRGGNGDNRLAIRSGSSAAYNGDEDSDVNLNGLNEWRLEGGRGNDVLDARGAPMVDAYGQEGADRLTGGRGPDDLYGDEGEEAADGPDVLAGGGGDDDLEGGGGGDRLSGQGGDDYLRGESGTDALAGGDGDDYMYSESTKDGADGYSGGAGGDHVAYYNRQAPLRLTLDGKDNDGAKRERDSIRADVEYLSGGYKADVIVGNSARNTLNGGEGDDVLRGMGSDDSFGPEGGADSVYGGDGDDYMGNSPGSDKFYGEGGDDYFSAGSSNDGRDVYVGGPGSDSIDYSGRSSGVTIDVVNDNGDGQAGENDFVKGDFERYSGGSAGDLIVGGSQAERFYGYDGDDEIRGGRGADEISGDAGADDLTGGEGRDSVDGDAGDDTLSLVDGAYDYGDCGSDTDLAYVDAGVDSIPNCESVVA